jgi:hypothetical protein
MPTATMKPMPTLMVGEPYIPSPAPPQLGIPEPVIAIGEKTGKAYFRMGDNQETMTVTPSKPGVTTVGPDGMMSMAGGGSAVFSPQEYDWRQKYNQAQQKHLRPLTRPHTGTSGRLRRFQRRTRRTGRTPAVQGRRHPG